MSAPTFTCPICDTVTHTQPPGYCANCHGLTAEPTPPGMRWVRLRGGQRIVGRLVSEPLPATYHMVASGEVYERMGDSDSYLLASE